jgi:hypothetical protein
MKISQKLKAKARAIKAKASTVARKGIIKGAAVAGYTTGRVGTEIATRPNVSKVVGKALDVADKVAKRIPKSSEAKSKMTNASKKVSARDQITATKATGAFIGGTLKGSYDGLSAAEKRNKKKK